MSLFLSAITLAAADFSACDAADASRAATTSNLLALSAKIASLVCSCAARLSVSFLKLLPNLDFLNAFFSISSAISTAGRNIPLPTLAIPFVIPPASNIDKAAKVAGKR